jgi:DNA-binding LacI/PurR family transcriptional regulator
MPQSRPTVRSLAAALGLSRATVSNALRGKGRIAESTARKVLKAAEAAGYAHNALAGALMSELRQSRGQTFRGVIATLEEEESERPPHGPFQEELVAGLRERAAELGYQLESFTVRREAAAKRRLNGILEARGIQGVAILPSWHEPDWSALDWTRLAGVYADYVIRKPALSCVTTDPFRSVTETLQRLAERGYRRPGLCIETERDRRTHFRFGAPFQAWPADERGWEAVPPLHRAKLERAEFEVWFRTHRPDVVLSHFTEIVDWMKALGAKVPRTHGFVGLNALYRAQPCAALDLQARVIGARCAEKITSMLYRQELGVPAWPTLTTVSARWVEGPTVRAVRAAKGR